MQLNIKCYRRRLKRLNSVPQQVYLVIDGLRGVKKILHRHNTALRAEYPLKPEPHASSSGSGKSLLARLLGSHGQLS